MSLADTETVPNIPNKPVRSSSGDIEYGDCVADSLFRRLVGLGVVLSVDGDRRLAIDAPAGVMSDDLVGRVRSCRDDLLALVEHLAMADTEDAPEPLGLGPGWLCPWCRAGDRLALEDPAGLRCGRCDRMAWRFVGDAIERCDWVEPLLVDAPDPADDKKRAIESEQSRKRGSVVAAVGRSLFDPAGESG